MPHRLLPALLLACLIVLPAEASSPCKASWYGGGEYLNRHTASGERFDPAKKTCALPSFRGGKTKPYPVRVTNLGNGRSVVCRVNDRGPAARLRRCIDLSAGAAKIIGMGPGRAGLARVKIEGAR